MRSQIERFGRADATRTASNCSRLLIKDGIRYSTSTAIDLIAKL